jgi:hypothetical protein
MFIKQIRRNLKLFLNQKKSFKAPNPDDTSFNSSYTLIFDKPSFASLKTFAPSLAIF